ncbi:hypothetical protein ScPMuIL_001271 [Solemya velum]
MANARLSDLSKLTWNEESKDLGSIIAESKLPILVKMSDKNAPARKEGGGSVFDMHQPMVLYKEVPGIKVYVKNVLPENPEGTIQYREIGPTVAIPQQYQGWFRLLNDDDAPLTTVASIARIMPIRIFSSKPVEGYKFLRMCEMNGKRNRGSEELFQRTEVSPATLEVHSIHEEYVRYCTDRKSTPKRKLMRCLRCTLEGGTDVLLPFDTKGEFYMVEVRKSSAKSQQVDENAFVFSIFDLIKAGLSEGIYVRHLHGETPNKVCRFTGILKICALVEDRTVLALSLNDTNKLIELPVSVGPAFTTALITDTADNLIQMVQGFLKQKSENYIRQMKVRKEYNIKDTEDKEPVSK